MFGVAVSSAFPYPYPYPYAMPVAVAYPAPEDPYLPLPAIHSQPIQPVLHVAEPRDYHHKKEVGRVKIQVRKKGCTVLVYNHESVKHSAKKTIVI